MVHISCIPEYSTRLQDQWYNSISIIFYLQ